MVQGGADSGRRRVGHRVKPWVRDQDWEQGLLMLTSSGIELGGFSKF